MKKKYIILFFSLLLIISFLFFFKNDNAQYDTSNSKQYFLSGESKNWQANLNIKQHKNKDGSYYRKEIFTIKYKNNLKKTSIKKINYSYVMEKDNSLGSATIHADSFGTKGSFVSESSDVSDKSFYVDEKIKVKVTCNDKKEETETFELKLK